MRKRKKKGKKERRMKEEEERAHQLGELRGPEVHGDDTIARHPVSVEISQHLLGSKTLLSLEAANEHTVGVLKILDGSALSQELGVREDLELDASPGVGLEDGPHALSGLAGNGGLLNDDLGGLGDLGDGASGPLDPLEISGAASTETRDLGGSVHRDEDDISFLDGPLHVSAEEQVVTTALYIQRMRQVTSKGKGRGSERDSLSTIS